MTSLTRCDSVFPHIFTDDLKLLSINRVYDQIQVDLYAIRNWKQNELSKGQVHFDLFYWIQMIYLQNVLNNSYVRKDLGIHIHESLFSEKHREHRVKKANSVLYILKSNISPKIARNVNLVLYKSKFLPVLVYGLQSSVLMKADLTGLKKFQKKLLKWIHKRIQERCWI